MYHDKLCEGTTKQRLEMVILNDGTGSKPAIQQTY